MSDTKTTGDEQAEAKTISRGIARTRHEMSGTIAEIEARLSDAPSVIREHAVEELHVVEAKVKEAVKEQFEEAKAKVKVELIEAKDTVKAEIREVLRDAQQGLRDATIGKVENMARDAKDTAVEVRDTFMDTVRANPIPAALAGVGLVWLFMNRSSSAEARRRAMYANMPRGLGMYDRDFPRANAGRFEGAVRGLARDAGQGATDAAHHVRDAAEHAVHDAADAAGSAAHQVMDGAGNLVHQVTDAAGSAMHGVRDASGKLVDKFTDAAGNAVHQFTDAAGNLVHQVTDAAGNVGTRVVAAGQSVGHQASSLVHQGYDGAQHLAGDAWQGARRVEHAAEETYQRNPLLIGAIAVAAGAAVGLALPRTEREDDLLGETRDDLVKKAEGLAHEALGSAHQYADRAADQIKDAIAQS